MESGRDVRGIVVDEDGAGVEGAVVLWAPAAADGAVAVPLGRAVATTASDGRFAAERLPARRVRFAARAPGRASAWRAPIDLDPAGAATDEVRVQTWRAVSFTFFVHDEATRSPVAGAEVALSAVDRSTSVRGVTDGEGEVVLDGARAGLAYVASVRAAGWAFSGVNTFSVPIGASNHREEIGLTRRGTPETARVVEAASGRPIAGARIAWSRLVQLLGPANPMMAPRGAPAGTTDASGRCSLAERPQRAPTLLVEASGFAPALARPRPGETLVELVPGGRLEVSVAWTVRSDRAGEPAGAVEIELRAARARWDPTEPAPGNPALPLLLRRKADDAGRATFEHLPPGAYAVVARRPGFGTAVETPVAVENGGRTTVRLELAEAGAIAGVVHGWALGVPWTVAARSDDDFVFSAQPDDEGAWVLEDLPAGEYAVEPVPLAADETCPVGPETVQVVPGVTARCDFDLDRVETRLRVRVNGRPAPGLEVRWKDAEGVGGGTSTDVEGFARVAASLPDEVEVRVWSARTSGRWLIARRRVRLVAGGEVAIDVSAGSLRAEAYAADDPAEPSPAIAFLAPDAERGGVPGFADDESWTLSVDASGAHDLERIPVGAYAVRPLGRQGTPMPPRSLRIEEGATARLRLPIERSGQ